MTTDTMEMYNDYDYTDYMKKQIAKNQLYIKSKKYTLNALNNLYLEYKEKANDAMFIHNGASLTYFICWRNAALHELDYRRKTNCLRKNNINL